MRKESWLVGLMILLAAGQGALAQDLKQEQDFKVIALDEASLLSYTLQQEVVPLTSGVPVRGSCPAHTDPNYMASLCPTEYTINLPENTISLLVILEKEGVTDLILAMSFSKSIHDRLRDDEGDRVWISRALDSPPTRDTEGMLLDEDMLRSRGRLPGTWYIGIITKEGSPQSYTLTALIETEEENEPPEANFDFSPSNPTTDGTVRFTDRSSDPDGDVVEWEWDFGDGSGSNRRSPTHRYTRAGTYTVTLTVTDDDGATDTARKRITVREALQPPEAPSNLQATVISTTEIRLTWRDNSNKEEGFLVERRRPGGSWGEIQRLGRNRTEYTDRELEPNTKYCYRVRAFNDAGTSNPTRERCATTERENRSPVADAGPDQTVQVGETVRLDGSDSSDPDGDPLSYEWRFFSRPPSSRAALSTPLSVRTSFVPDVVGQYVVELTVKDGRGGTDTDTVTIIAEEAPPPTYTYEGSFTRGRQGVLPVPEEIKRQLPQIPRFLERPNRTHEGEHSDSLREIGLQINETTGTIFGTPSRAGSFRFLVEVQDQGQENATVAFLWALVTVAETEPQLEVAPQELRLSANVGDPNPTTTFAIRNAGGGTLTWTARPEAGVNWLQLEPTQGVLEAGRAQEVTVTALLAGLSAGIHSTRITVKASGIGMAIVQVTLDLRGGEAPPSPPSTEGPLTVEPATLAFQAVISGSNPAPQPLRLTNHGEEPLAWEARVETEDVEGWLQLDFTSGPALAPGGSVMLTVSVDIAGLAAGTYQGMITFSAPRNPEVPKVEVPVTLTIRTQSQPPTGKGELLALKFLKLEFLRPQDWERTLKEGCVVYTNVSTEPSPIRVTLPDGSTQEYAIPADRKVIVCGDVVHVDTRS